MIENNQKTIISLCDYSGAWSKPYRENGYQVKQIDLAHGQDVRLMELPGYPVHGILCAPPCTHFASSGARWWASKGDDLLIDGLSIVDACLRLVLMTKPIWWCLENPIGRLNRWIGQPQMYFNPCDYGDPYTKRTALWGEFNTDLPLCQVEPVQGSKMHLRYGGKSQRTKRARSITPSGFAEAFYLANP